MKILFDCQNTPFFLAHGGADIQIRSTCEALRKIGIDADYVKWWDPKQEADLIHTFSVPDASYLKFAAEKGIPVVCTSLFTANCNNPDLYLYLKGLLVSSVLKSRRIPVISTFRAYSRWESFRTCSCNVVGLQAEVDVLKKVHGVPDEKVRIIPLGLSEAYLHAEPGPRDGNYLISTGTITERKRSLELAEMAHAMKVPLLFVGKAYSEDSDYWKRFKQLVDGHWVRHIPHTDDVLELISLTRAARGYVLDSYYENWCLAAHEAIACRIPILVPDQRWSRERFGNQANYLKGNHAEKSRQLKTFYNEASSMSPPDIKLHSWVEVAHELKELYISLLKP